MRTPFKYVAFLALVPFNQLAFAQTPPPAGEATAAAAEQKPETPAPKPGEPKPYKDVVTKDAVTQTGMFKVHRIDDKILWEIPVSKLNKELLWQTEVAELPPLGPFSYPGTATGARVVRFTRRGNKIYLRNVEKGLRAFNDAGLEKGVAWNTLEPIIFDFAVEAEGGEKDAKTAVIDVTQLFTSDPADFSVRSAVSAGGANPNRSFVDSVKAFPKNIETRSVLTFMGAGGGGFFFGGGPRSDASTVTAKVHYSLVELPEKPMQPRLKDSRIGFFTVGFTEFGRPDGISKATEYISRFRLEKKDPNAALSEPKEPIVYYLSREVPDRWRKWLKKGVEDWQVAFEQAGFKNAIICKDAPTEAEDPNWHPEDVRYSVIRWAPSQIANAMGPSIQDPRSGETISAHIIFWNDIVKLLEEWYFAQCAATDPKAAKLPFPEELMGELVRYVSAHEVGHTLGLEHNFKGSAWYTPAQLRDPKFTNLKGLSASIMDYSRFNYVAQPGDNVTRTIGMIGDYDKFAIEYGYKPIPGAGSAEAEKPFLDRHLAQQVNNPSLRFGNYKYFQDPTVQTEDISSDAVEATRLGLLNLDNIATTKLLTATTKFGEDYTKLSEMVSNLLGQRFTELYHVVENIGGVIESDNHAGRGGVVFRQNPVEKQRRAVKFLATTGMQTPKGLFTPEIRDRIAPDGLVGDVVGQQRFLFSALFNEDRVSRMFDLETANPKNHLSVEEMLKTVQGGVFTELASPAPKIDIFRRNLQRSYLTAMDGRINGYSATKTDLKLLVKAELKALAKQIDAAMPKTKDKLTSLHLAQTREDIGKILADKFSKDSGGGGFEMLSMFGIEKATWSKLSCFSPWAKLPRSVQKHIEAQLAKKH